MGQFEMRNQGASSHLGTWPFPVKLTPRAQVLSRALYRLERSLFAAHSGAVWAAASKRGLFVKHDKVALFSYAHHLPFRLLRKPELSGLAAIRKLPKKDSCGPTDLCGAPERSKS